MFPVSGQKGPIDIMDVLPFDLIDVETLSISVPVILQVLYVHFLKALGDFGKCWTLSDQLWNALVCNAVQSYDN